MRVEKIEKLTRKQLRTKANTSFEAANHPKRQPDGSKIRNLLPDPARA